MLNVIYPRKIARFAHALTIQCQRHTWTTVSLFIAAFTYSQNGHSESYSNNFAANLAKAAAERTQQRIIYDGRYFAIDYPNGDVPPNIGVCTDVVIRSYRALGIDLQQLVHEDMQANFQHYPAKRIWGQNKPDSNIDHRRVPNLETFFARHGQRLKTTMKPTDYLPGDIVSWRLPGSNLPHIGIISANTSDDGTPLVIHNIGEGPKLENVLFAYSLAGHFRFQPQ